MNDIAHYNETRVHLYTYSHINEGLLVYITSTSRSLLDYGVDVDEILDLGLTLYK